MASLGVLLVGSTPFFLAAWKEARRPVDWKLWGVMLLYAAGFCVIWLLLMERYYV